MKKKLLFWVLTLTALLLMATSAQARIVASAPCPSCQVTVKLSSAEGTHCVYTCDDCGEFTIYHTSHDRCHYCTRRPECSFQSDVPNQDGTHSSGCALSLQSGEPCPNYGDVVIEDCSGGTATCTELAICESCGASYGELASEQHVLSDWKTHTTEQHFKHCVLCWDPETFIYEDHYGGAATCRAQAVCEVCGTQYGDYSTEHDISDWVPRNDEQHYKYCTLCWDPETFIYEDHYGGTATCIGQAVCEVCGTQYGDLSTEHDISDWEPCTTEQHFKYCVLCWDQETLIFEDHYGGAATCSELAACEACGQLYGERSDVHVLSDWENISSKQHRKYCVLCVAPESFIYEDHYGGTATCAKQAICEACGESYGELDTVHSRMSSWYPSTTGGHFRYCRLCGAEDSMEFADHYDETGDGLCDACGDTMPCTHPNLSGWSPANSDQHSRYCPDCESRDSYEYENHYGGTATCGTYAICEGCGAPYGATTGVHLNISDWKNYNSTQHLRFCEDCGYPETYEFESHYGGTATCTEQATCEGCGVRYGELSDEHPNMSPWGFPDGSQHYRECMTCGNHREYENHYGGTATCAEQAICGGCGARYGDYTEHDISDWGPGTAKQHCKYCVLCMDEETFIFEDHYGGTATCIERATCEVCGESYGEFSTEHVLSDWAPYSDSQHQKLCVLCWNPETFIFEDHYGGTATCSEQAVCEVCGMSYGDYTEHDMSDWESRTDEQHYKHCTLCWDPETFINEDHYGGTATCTVRATCEGCGASYGEFSTEHVLSDWEFRSGSQHQKYCVLCLNPASFIYEDHYGGTATCSEQAVCEVCGESYGELGTVHHQMSQWIRYSYKQHVRYCMYCTSSDRYEYADHYDETGDGLCDACGAAPCTHSNMSRWSPVNSTQHSRYCSDCESPDSYEYENHYGGTATCADLATCEGCGAIYGELSDEHPSMSNWVFSSDSQHYRWCLTCGSSYEEYEDHYGGTATCADPAICEGCGERYGELSDEHSSMSSWIFNNDSQHYRWCLTCGSYREYENHYGGTATCFDLATCEGCGARYGELSDEHPNMSNWVFSSDSQHYRWCLTCGSYREYEDHYGGTATCRDKAKCEGCRRTYGELSTEHQWGEWEWLNESQHVHYCSVCTDVGYASHQGGDGSCMPTCEDCDEVYYDPSGEHTSMTDWIHYNAKQHFRCCETCGTGYEYADHYGGTATCVQEAICEGCGARHGDTDPNNHTTYSEWQPESQTQHSRHCADCKSPSTYEYEDHYSSDTSCMPVCDSCKVPYFDLDGEHTMSVWCYDSDEQHFRYCTVCLQPDAFEYAAHTITTGVCASTCEDCSSIFYDPNGTHVGLTDWAYFDDKSHYRYCAACMNLDEYEEHSGGEADCSNRAICDVCGSPYGDYASDKHRWGDWSCFDSSVHLRTCAACSTSEGGAHTGGNGSCIPDCEHCGGRYIDANGEHRNMSQWFYVDAETHYRFCVDCGEYEETASHAGGKATCSALAVCDDCEEFYGDYDTDAHEWGEWLPDENGMHVRICNLNSQHKEHAPCTWGDWTWLSDAYHVRECVDCGEKQTAAHTGGTATCSTPAICEGCNTGYGEPDDSGMTGHPNPTIEEKPGTCYDEGYYRITCNEPGCTMPFFEIILPANGQHLYNHWDVLGGNKHHTDCAQCGEGTDVACTLWELYEGEAPLSVCPICGDFARALFEILIARDDAAVPIGTLLVRGLADPIDGALFGFTVSGVYGGELVDIHGPVTITIPVDCEGFTVVRVEIVDGAEVRTELPFTLENGQLTIETATAGLFLLVPAK